MNIHTKRGAAALSVVSNSALVVFKLIVGLGAGSVSILSEAAHSAIDLAASFIALFSVRVADVPADEEHPFGHGKIENVSGVVEALLIFVAAIYIVYESVQKLTNPGHVQPIEPGLGILVMAGSVVANYLISRLLFRVARETDSVALEADGHHLRTDVWTSLGVFAGLVLMQIMNLLHMPGTHYVDAIVAIGVALLIMKVAFDLTREAGRPLVDTSLPHTEIEQVRNILLSDERVIGFHKLRTRKAGAFRHIDVHIIVHETLTVGQAHDVAEEVEDKIRAELGFAQVVTHVEPDTEENLRDTPPEGLAENGNCGTSERPNGPTKANG